MNIIFKFRKELFMRYGFIFLLVFILILTLISVYINKESSLDFDRVNKIRSWASERTPWAYGRTQIKKSIQGKDAQQIFQMYEQNTGGVDCSGAAYSLMKLYKQYGFEAYEYHYGDLKGWNHVITLVKINYKGKDILAIEDAFFNVTYTYADGSPIDFFIFLTLIKNNQENLIVMKKNNNQKHYYICDEQDSCPIPSDKKKIVRLDTHKIKYETKTYFGLLERNYHSFLLPRFLQGSVDGVGVGDMMDRIKSTIKSKK